MQCGSMHGGVETNAAVCCLAADDRLVQVLEKHVQMLTHTGRAVAAHPMPGRLRLLCMVQGWKAGMSHVGQRNKRLANVLNCFTERTFLIRNRTQAAAVPSNALPHCPVPRLLKLTQSTITSANPKDVLCPAHSRQE